MLEIIKQYQPKHIIIPLAPAIFGNSWTFPSIIYALLIAKLQQRHITCIIGESKQSPWKTILYAIITNSKYSPFGDTEAPTYLQPYFTPSKQAASKWKKEYTIGYNGNIEPNESLIKFLQAVAPNKKLKTTLIGGMNPHTAYKPEYQHFIGRISETIQHAPHISITGALTKMETYTWINRCTTLYIDSLDTVEAFARLKIAIQQNKPILLSITAWKQLPLEVQKNIRTEIGLPYQSITIDLNKKSAQKVLPSLLTYNKIKIYQQMTTMVAAYYNQESIRQSWVTLLSPIVQPSRARTFQPIRRLSALLRISTN